jgi:hypothetical protein
MNNLFDEIKNQFKNSFKSQDSKYFIFTACKITLVPLLAFCIVFYSFWTVLEMNYNFFAANGFLTGEDNKATFFDTVLFNLSDYLFYFSATMVGVFMVGILTSYFALRSFSHVENFIHEMEDDINANFEVSALNQSKLINQVSKIFFKYLQLYGQNKVRPKFKLPKKLQVLSSPPVDKVFLFQYVSIVGIICLVTNIILFSFTHELYQEIVSAGIRLLPGNQVVASFLVAQEAVLFNIYAIAIVINVSLYLAISKSIIKTVDGVSYGFARDMLQIVNGDHQLRLRPRLADPGKDVAISLNQLLDEVLYTDELSSEDPEDEEAAPIYLDSPVELSKQSFVDSELNDEEFEDEDITLNSYKEELSIAPDLPIEEEDELPPTFIEEKQVANGERVFQVTTPNGMKLDGLNEDLVLKLVNEIENKK